MLSLDAVFVATIWQWFIAKTFGLVLSWQEELILGLTVWLIYTLDRLFDGLKLDLEKKHSLRHEFYYKHYFEFSLLALVVLGLDGFFVLTSLDIFTITLGLVVFALVLLYGLGLHLFSFARAYKELHIGVLFSIGVSLVFLKNLSLNLVIAIVLFAILASLNCLLISSWEQQLDKAQNYHSGIFNNNLDKLLTKALIVFMVLSLGLFLFSFKQVYFAIFLSLALLLFLDSQKNIFSDLVLRILVDLALLSPVIFMVF